MVRRSADGVSQGTLQFVDIGMEYLVHEPDTGTLVGVLVGKFDMNAPYSSREGSCFIRRRTMASINFDSALRGRRHSLSSGPLKRT